MTDTDIETSREIRRLIAAARAVARHCDQAPLVWFSALQQPLPLALRGGSDPVSANLLRLADFDPWADLPVPGVDPEPHRPVAPASTRRGRARETPPPPVGARAVASSAVGEQNRGVFDIPLPCTSSALAKVRGAESLQKPAAGSSGADRAAPNSDRNRDAVEYFRDQSVRSTAGKRNAPGDSQLAPGATTTSSRSSPGLPVDRGMLSAARLADRRVAIAREGFGRGHKTSDKTPPGNPRAASSQTQSLSDATDHYATSSASLKVSPVAEPPLQQRNLPSPQYAEEPHAVRPAQPRRLRPGSTPPGKVQPDGISRSNETPPAAVPPRRQTLEVSEPVRGEVEPSTHRSSASNRQPVSLAADDLARRLTDAVYLHGIDLS